MRRERERHAAAPPSAQLRGDQLAVEAGLRRGRREEPLERRRNPVRECETRRSCRSDRASPAAAPGRRSSRIDSGARAGIRRPAPCGSTSGTTGGGPPSIDRLRKAVAVAEVRDVAGQPARVVDGRFAERRTIGQPCAQPDARRLERVLGLREHEHERVDVAARQSVLSNAPAHCRRYRRRAAARVTGPSTNSLGERCQAIAGEAERGQAGVGEPHVDADVRFGGPWRSRRELRHRRIAGNQRREEPSRRRRALDLQHEHAQRRHRVRPCDEPLDVVEREVRHVTIPSVRR